MNQTAQIQIQYVNPREGNRPPSIKDSQGNRFTVNDAAIAQFQPSMQGNLGFYTNPKGFNIATHWNGQELPKTGRSFQGPTVSPSTERMPQNVNPMPQKNTQGREIFITGIVGRAMGSGQFGATDIALLTKAAWRAWNEMESDYLMEQRGPNLADPSITEQPNAPIQSDDDIHSGAPEPPFPDEENPFV